MSVPQLGTSKRERHQPSMYDYDSRVIQYASTMSYKAETRKHSPSSDDEATKDIAERISPSNLHPIDAGAHPMLQATMIALSWNTRPFICVSNLATPANPRTSRGDILGRHELISCLGRGLCHILAGGGRHADVRISSWGTRTELRLLHARLALFPLLPSCQDAWPLQGSSLSGNA
jgi:hypothetical protein